MKLTSTLLMIFLALSGALLNVTAQSGYTERHDSLQSGILNQNRKLSIFLPDGYDTCQKKFPVIYVLDADGRDQHTVPTARFLFLNNKMPQAIVVGVMNIDRNHDFLPDSSQNAPTGGGADKFIQFFSKELIPYIDKNFKTEPYKVLVGHSYGGLFAMHALLNEPDLFDSYIAIDPSFWYKDQMLIKSAPIDFVKAKNWNHTIFITGREGRGMSEMGINSMEKVLQTSAPKTLNWKIASYTDEDHGSVTFKSVYDGLRFIFDAGGNFMILPNSGIIPAGQSTFAYIENINPNLRYTIDGTEPGINSPLCTEKIKISGACTLKVKSVATKYKTLPSSSSVFTKGEFMHSQKAADLKPGLKYSYYEGVWDSLPDFSKLNPVKTGITESIDLKFALKRDSFAVQFEGFLRIAKKGLYDFWILSDDGSEVLINDKPVMVNDGIHSADIPKVVLIPLEAGDYPFIVRYFQKGGGKAIAMGTIAGKKKTEPAPISNDMFFHTEF